jgi:hypothetical protein
MVAMRRKVDLTQDDLASTPFAKKRCGACTRAFRFALPQLSLKSSTRARGLPERPGSAILSVLPEWSPNWPASTGWPAMADTSDLSRNLTHAVRTCLRHDRQHRGKQHEHQQRHETGGRREARQILWER